MMIIIIIVIIIIAAVAHQFESLASLVLSNVETVEVTIHTCVSERERVLLRLVVQERVKFMKFS